MSSAFCVNVLLVFLSMYLATERSLKVHFSSIIIQFSKSFFANALTITKIVVKTLKNAFSPLMKCR